MSSSASAPPRPVRSTTLPGTPGSRSFESVPQFARSPRTTNSPPPFETKLFSTSPELSAATSLRMTTRWRLEIGAGDRFTLPHVDLKGRARCRSTSAFCRYRLASRDARGGSTTKHRKPLRRRHDEVKHVVLLQRVVADAHGAARERARQRERLERDRRRRAGRHRDRLRFDARARRARGAPARCLTAAGPRLMMPAATVTRSCPEKIDRCGSTDDTVRFAVCASVIAIGVNVVPSGSRRFSSRTQPLRWKSLIMTTSRVCSVESASTRCASFSAGRVPRGLGAQPWRRRSPP